MELIIGIIIIYLAYQLIKWFIVNVLPWLLRGSGIVVLIIIGAGALVGFGIAIKNYVKAIRTHLNFSKWKWKKGDEPAIRSYFFGPGYQQLRDTIKTAFILNHNSVQMSTGFFLFRIPLAICVYVLGTFITVIFAAIHGTVTTVVMIFTYIIFSIIWFVDRSYLWIRQIRSVCPNCKQRYLIPHFKCPQCEKVHKKLVPGPYGVMNHRCVCNYKLPATFFNGRSKLDSVCPKCGAALVASDARQIGIQLIGGSKSGKSVLLAALFHEYLGKLGKIKHLDVEITDDYKPYFDELEGWFAGGDVPPTEQLNSQMYPILLKSKYFKPKRQLSIYDIAGEMFDGTTARGVNTQEQFSHCNGLFFLLDPFSDGDLRRSRMQTGGSMGDFSNMKPDVVAENFVNYMIEIGKMKADERCKIPMAILIAKSDIREIKSVIGPAKINSLVKKGEYKNYTVARDSECREFLRSIGLDQTVDVLEMRFSNLHYFPISAMGHSPDGDPYEPWGIMEVMDWLIPLADEEVGAVVR